MRRHAEVNESTAVMFEQSARVWLLRFEFAREGVTANATEQ